MELFAEHGLKRGAARWLGSPACDHDVRGSSNAMLADQFLEHFDGFSIGSNDLTQLTLGIDRDSGLSARRL